MLLVLPPTKSPRSETISIVKLETRAHVTSQMVRKVVLSSMTRRKFCKGLGNSALAIGASLCLPVNCVAQTSSEEAELKTFRINNRRFLGNKYKLLQYIRKVIDENCTDVYTFVDIFAGTGSVASAFADKKLVTNDILYSSYICHIAWFSGEDYSREKIISILKSYNAAQVDEDNYMSQNFSDTYFSRSDCRKIGFIRGDIEQRFRSGQINNRERALLITSLIYAMDKIADTVGHYDAWRRGVKFEKNLELRLPQPPECLCKENECYNEDANVLATKISADVVFMDPPYNSRQYSDSYHLLENVARWDKPPVKGVARKMDRSELKSDYCTSKAEAAFADLIDKIDARYIVLTYNNMESKGNDRSNAKLSDEAIMETLSQKGEVKVFNVSHKAFSTGKSKRDDNVERIFLCICNSKKYIASPLNYTGGKYRLLNQMLPVFPQTSKTFVDLFCGGANVGVNISAERVILSDSCSQLICLFQTMQRLGADAFVDRVKKVISQYGLSNSTENGYEHYGCESSSGLGSYNKVAYSQLKKHYATLKDEDDQKSIELYVLIVFGFNNQIRFNSKGEYNLPVGKRDFNSKMERKLRVFINKIQLSRFSFLDMDFRQLDVDSLGEGDFVYADPPYLVTTASYNENGGWNETDERSLLSLLDDLHSRGCKFALSNVLESKGKTNTILTEWLSARSTQYRVISIKSDDTNSNYHRKNDGESKEILVVNY